MAKGGFCLKCNLSALSGLILRHEANLLLGVHDALDGGVDVGDAVLAGQEAGG